METQYKTSIPPISNENPASKDKKRLTPLTLKEKFQRTVFKACHEAKRQNEQTKEANDNVGSAFKVKMSGGEELTFDVDDFRPNKVSISGLTYRARLILVKQPAKRTDTELRSLMEVVNSMKCFAKYSKTVRKELPKIIYYDSINAGRRIIKQGHVARSLYFLVSGSAIVQYDSTDPETGKTQKTLLGEIKEGSSFGEVALVHNVKRTATVICKDHCELLRVDKDDFDPLLARSEDTELSNRLKALKSLPALAEWSDEELLALNRLCRNVNFPKNKVLAGGDTSEQSDYVFFLTGGEIKVVREMFIAVRYRAHGLSPVYVPPTSSQVQRMTTHQDMRRRREVLKTPEICRRRLWTICTLGKGFCYGVGENLDKSYLVSKTRVEVIQIPKCQFIKHGKWRIIDRFRENLNDLLPGNDLVFRAFLEAMKWERYKRKVVDQVLEKRKLSNPTRIQDVPLSIQEDLASVSEALNKSFNVF